ncbi:hypothetical protein [Zunongwangia endophytica]|uniref:GLPGLI family protein n=1 Tax=Zunongwangia endophytica TaxID=1808945 RepID=A0ABV8H4A7_9FLAO|nr:hypothetical protein [Zunongwangia endophytica]MDN3595789.1 hypothetical protein [Zunongwangia endophytica]
MKSRFIFLAIGIFFCSIFSLDLNAKDEVIENQITCFDLAENTAGDYQNDMLNEFTTVITYDEFMTIWYEAYDTCIAHGGY